MPQDYAKAVEWYTKAAEQGHARAQNNLGDCYEKGTGVFQSDLWAIYWYNKAAEQNEDEQAQEYAKKRLKEKYPHQGDYIGYAEEGSAVGQFKLGLCYYTSGGGVPQSYEKAAEWFAKAAEQDCYEAQYYICFCHEMGRGVPQSYEKAAEWYMKSVTRKYCASEYRLGLCYYYGRGVAQSYEKAFEWFTKAEANGLDEAKYQLAVCYENGYGVPRSCEKAVELYSKAAKWYASVVDMYLDVVWNGIENAQKALDDLIASRCPFCGSYKAATEKKGLFGVKTVCRNCGKRLPKKK